ncbi:MAG: CAP domain-containing protein [Candidatus Dojkabacteria bacterium]
MLKNLFIPNQTNKYTPHLLSKSALLVYLAVLIIFNFTIAQLPFADAGAIVDAQTLYNFHNNERERVGLSRLTINSDLISSATSKAQEMLAANCWSHFCPEGKSPWTFFDEVGYRYIFAGENLAEGFENNETVMKAWMNSPTHRDNILKAEFDEIGIGFATGSFQGIATNTIVVVHFGSRSETLNSLPASEQLDLDSETVTIESPTNGAHIKNPEFEIAGQTPVGSTVELKANNKSLGSVDAEGGNFTFRPPSALDDGGYGLIATAFDNNSTTLGISSKVEVVVDTVAPSLVDNSLLVNSLNFSDQMVIVSVRTQGEPIILSTNIPNVSFSNISEDNWETEVPRAELESKANFTIEAIDRAGNKSKTEFPSASLLAEVLAFDAVQPGEGTFASSNIVISFFDNLLGKDLKVKVNLIFIVFLGILFGADFYVLSKAGLTGIRRSKSHLHISAVVILIIIALIGGLSGSVLTGIQFLR